MRLHRLTVRAFGPFAQQQTVDLDELSAQGLFLLHGPTGAGKTSVLDAICFALYGRVPGSRAGQTQLKSDHADPDETPEVSCEFSVGPRRFFITRSPAWERPKRRGEGTTLQQARVVLQEYGAGEWKTRTTRIDEAAQLIDDVVGMGAEQFTKVVMLPQGEFAAFLRADAEERRAMLQRLFGAQRFTAIQDWLRDKRMQLSRDVEQADAAAATQQHHSQDLLAALRRDSEHLADDPSVLDEADRRLLRQACSEPHGETASEFDCVAAEKSGPDNSAPEHCAQGNLLQQEQKPPSNDGASAASSPGAPESSPAASASAAAQLSPAPSNSTALALAAVQRDLLRVQAVDQALATIGTRQRHQGTELEERRAQGQETLRLTKEFAALRQRQDTLRQATDDIAQAREQLHRSEQAQPVASFVEPIAQAAQRCRQAESLVTTARASVQSAMAAAQPSPDVAPGPHAAPRHDVAQLDRAVLTQIIDDTNAEVAQLRERSGDITELDELREELEHLQEAIREAEQQLGECERDRTEAMAQVDQLGKLASQLHERATHLPAAQAAAAHARSLADAVAQREELTPQCQAAQRHELTAREERNGAWQQLLDIRERRLAGIAAELAAKLEPDAACPVCGSLEHPQLADPEAASVSEADEAAAQLAHETADTAWRQATAELNTVTAQLKTAQHVADRHTADQAAEQLAHAQQALAAAQAAQLDGEQTQQEQEQATKRASEAREREVQTREQLERHRRSYAARTERHEVLTQRLTQLVGDFADVPMTITRLQQRADCCAQLREALAQQQAADEHRADIQTAAGDAATRANFDDLPQALAALLPDNQVSQLRAKVSQWDIDTAALATQLAEPCFAPLHIALATYTAIQQQENATDELADLTAHLERHEQLAQRVAALAAHAQASARQLQRMCSQLQENLQSATQLDEEYLTVAELSRCLDGTGGENARRMTLSAFVVAARLEQVVQAATQRLQHMSQGRYSLEHCDAVAKGRARSGLSLAVVDAWTGKSRDCATLSGGESFYTSLALALGLADVVTVEAGGSALETLFVDEGFGSLDEQTLEEVMDVLDDLRSGGRSVGIVSHVTDLRERIPTQLQVTKTPHGSQLTARYTS